MSRQNTVFMSHPKLIMETLSGLETRKVHNHGSINYHNYFYTLFIYTRVFAACGHWTIRVPRPLDFVLQALRPCDPHIGDWIVC